MMSSLPDGLTVSQLCASLGGRVVLHEVELRLPQAQWTCVVGPNGAGKSTLLRAIARLMPCSGQVRWLGHDPDTLSRRDRAKTLSWLGQSEGANADLRVRDAVMLSRLPHLDWLSSPSAQDHHVVDSALQAMQVWHCRDRGANDSGYCWPV
jgi:iron complex transport system ATP-binding protein